MIYLIMAGRLGNQMFQYAFARKIQNFTGQDICIDFTAINQVIDSSWKDYLQYYNTVDYKIVDKRGYYPVQRFIYKGLREIRKHITDNNQYKFDESVMNYFGKMGVYYYEADYRAALYANTNAKNIIIRGWFESAKYFKEIDEEIKKELQLSIMVSKKNKELCVYLQNNEAICVTVRRGNFTQEGIREKFLVCEKKYYEDAVIYIQNLFPCAVVYVCSDDIEWCKKELHFGDNVIYEIESDVCIKLHIMSACRHFVISNSTFSWWAQHLSDNDSKIVIAPDHWNNKKLSPQDIYEDNWLRMDSCGRIIMR